MDLKQKLNNGFTLILCFVWGILNQSHKVTETEMEFLQTVILAS